MDDDNTFDAQELQSLQCKGCGGTFGLLEQLHVAVCPYCALEQAVPADVRQRARAYGQEALIELELLEWEVRKAASVSPKMDWRRQILWTVTVLFGFAAYMNWMTSNDLWFKIAFTVVTVAIVVAAKLLDPGPPSFKRKRRLGHVTAACSGCGARVKISVGHAVGVCKTCGATQAKTDAVIAAALTVAKARMRRQKRDERLKYLRSVGRWDYARSRENAFRYSAYLIYGLGLLVVLGIAMRDQKSYLAPVYFLLLPVPLIATTLLVGRRRKRMSRLPAFIHLRKRLPGTVLVSDGQESLPWVATFWPHEWHQMQEEHGFCAALTNFHGFPVMVSAADNAAGSTLEILVACEETDPSDGRRWNMADKTFERYVEKPHLLLDLVTAEVERMQALGKRPAPAL